MRWVEWQIPLVKTNPLHGIKEYKIDDAKENYLSKDEISLLLEYPII